MCDSLLKTQKDEEKAVEDDKYQENEFPSDPEPLHYWGRLYPAKLAVRYYDLTKDIITVGKLRNCDICIKADEVPSDVYAAVSRQHFSIVRSTEDCFGKPTYRVRLKDNSMNGTYVNGGIVGRGNVKTLRDNCIIAVGRQQNEVFYYKDALVAQAPDLLKQKYDICIRLGTGAFGEVHLVFNKETGRSYAMKTIHKGSSTSQKKLKTEIQKLENEVKILRRIKHPNVIQLVDDIDCDTEKYLFLELMGGKDLFNRVVASKRLSEPVAKLYFYQIASGVQYLHENGIIHRDLKPENILLATDEEYTLLKITDFGLSKALDSTTYLVTYCGTKLYVAPEVLTSGGSKKYTSQVDIWSMGAVLFVCLSGESPFIADKQGKSMDDQIKEGDYIMSDKKGWEGVSQDARNIIFKMMTVDPEKRISIMSLFDDPWLQDDVMLCKVKALVEPNTNKENIPGQHPEVFGEPSSPLLPSVKLMSPSLPSNKRLKLS